MTWLVLTQIPSASGMRFFIWIFMNNFFVLFFWAIFNNFCFYCLPEYFCLHFSSQQFFMQFKNWEIKLNTEHAPWSGACPYKQKVFCFSFVITWATLIYLSSEIKNVLPLLLIIHIELNKCLWSSIWWIHHLRLRVEAVQNNILEICFFSSTVKRISPF